MMVLTAIYANFRWTFATADATGFHPAATILFQILFSPIADGCTPIKASITRNWLTNAATKSEDSGPLRVSLGRRSNKRLFRSGRKNYLSN